MGPHQPWYLYLALFCSCSHGNKINLRNTTSNGLTTLFAVVHIRIAKYNQAPTSNMLRSMIHNMRERHFSGMRRQTELLDPQTREHLREFLEDMPAEVDDMKQLQNELDEAHERLAKLLEKEAFVGKRIQSYRDQLQQFQEQQGKKKDAIAGSEEIQTSQKENYEKHLDSIQKIEALHKTMQRGIEVLEERIEIMEHRQSELRHLADECDVVYQTAEELRNMGLDTTIPASGESVPNISTKNDTEESSAETIKVDEETGEIELASKTSVS